MMDERSGSSADAREEITMDLALQVKPKGDDTVIASYSCPCGCTPRAAYTKGADVTTDGCCCGNTFAVGPDAAAHLPAAEGFTIQVDRFDAPWGAHLQAAWSLGQADAASTGEGHGHHDHHPEATSAIDPVCGMSVDIAGARAKDLYLTHEGTDHYFCGKGCKLEFGDDPARFLDPSYIPSM
jgi:YHS domain-containing protein